MKPVILIVIISFTLLVSCYKPYDANIDADRKTLMVNGLITNENTSYKVRLSYALPFDSSGKGQPVHSAYVHVTDDLGNYYAFVEKSDGNYISDSLQFTGHPGNTYTLHIKTYEGDLYESYPQFLNPEASPDSVYAEFDYQEILSKISGLLELTHGANILIDIKNQVDTLPRFRFTTNLVTQYIYKKCPSFGPCIIYYCWQTENVNPNINLTGGEYSTNSASVNKHAICFIDNNLYIFAKLYGTNGEYGPCMVSSRVIYLNQYTLNNEAYLYYKSMDEQLRSNGKLFDPIAVQLIGNIKCIGNPDKKAFGFFEASSVSHTSYEVDFRNLIDAQPSITKIPYILPPEPNGYQNNPPSFWIY